MLSTGSYTHSTPTPWGPSDLTRELHHNAAGEPDAILVSTPSHGGVGLRGAMADRLRAILGTFVPYAHRDGCGVPTRPDAWVWLEEDCDIYLAVHLLPERFPQAVLDAADMLAPPYFAGLNLPGAVRP